jgi:hypothetical protein
VYLTYDNIAVVGSNRALVESIQHAILKRLAESKINVKESFFCHGKSLRLTSSENKCCHLGLQYGISKRLFVRIAPKTAARWESSLGAHVRHGPPVTKRELARVCGVVLHARRMRGRRLYDCAPLLAAMQSLYPLRSWEDSIAVPEALRVELADALRNEWSPVRCLPKTSDCIIASDASGTGVGYVILDARTQQLAIPPYSDNARFEKTNDPNQRIFVKELIAALMALVKAAELGFRNPILLMDNAAGAAALTNGFSTNSQPVIRACANPTSIARSRTSLTLVSVTSNVWYSSKLPVAFVVTPVGRPEDKQKASTSRE